jgi:hypothetical protein
VLVFGWMLPFLVKHLGASPKYPYRGGLKRGSDGEALIGEDGALNRLANRGLEDGLDRVVMDILSSVGVGQRPIPFMIAV